VRDVGNALNEVARLELARGDLDAALGALVESRDIARKLADPHQPRTLRDLYISLNNVARVEIARGKSSQAKVHLQESLRILTDLQRGGKLLPEWRGSLAWVQDQLARLDSMSGMT
jgi:hypothetical protein